MSLERLQFRFNNQAPKEIRLKTLFSNDRNSKKERLEITNMYRGSNFNFANNSKYSGACPVLVRLLLFIFLTLLAM